MPKVFIYPGDSYHAAIEMFERRGFEVVKDYEKVDLVCFLGGTDVFSELYGEKPGPYTQKPDMQRDALECAAYNKWSASGIPMVGICRGGQLLNVLNGGEMIQHLGGSGVRGDVEAWDCLERIELRVDHHQGMLPADDCEEFVYYEGYPGDGTSFNIMYTGYYPETKSLCFQPHPEWGHQGTEDYFFELIEEHLGLKGTA